MKQNTDPTALHGSQMLGTLLSNMSYIVLDVFHRECQIQTNDVNEDIKPWFERINSLEDIKSNGLICSEESLNEYLSLSHREIHYYPIDIEKDIITDWMTGETMSLSVWISNEEYYSDFEDMM